MTTKRNTKAQVQESILKNHSDDLVKCFEKYRNFISRNGEFRLKFYGILKKEIMLSLSNAEKEDLLQEIQMNIYSTPNHSYPVTDFDVMYNYQPVNQVYSNHFAPSTNYSSGESEISSHDQQFTFGGGPDNNGYEIIPVMNCNNHYGNGIIHSSGYIPQQRQFNTNDQVYIYEDTLVSRSTRVKNDRNIDSFSSASEIETISSLNSDSSIESSTSLSLIKEQFHKLSELINNDDTIGDELENIKVNHGFEVYRQIIQHVPIKNENESAVKEPLMFQLVFKYDRYESVLDKLMEDGLLLMNQKNQFNMSIYNVLLIKDFNTLCKLLSYIMKKNIEHEIRYIQCRNDVLIRWNSDNGARKLNKGEQFMITKGILYCRELLKNKESGIVRKLKELNFLQAFLTEDFGNEKAYIKHLSNDYPNSNSILDLVIKEDYSVIFNSSFMVLLAQRNIMYFYQFLIHLMNDFKINRRLLCKSCRNQSFEGNTIENILEKNTNPEFHKSVKHIREFIDQYKDEQ